MCPMFRQLLFSFAKIGCSRLSVLGQFIDMMADTATTDEVASDRTATVLTFGSPYLAQRLAHVVEPGEDRAGMADRNATVDSNSTHSKFIHRILGDR